MSNSNLKPIITDLGAYPPKSVSEYEVRKLLDEQLLQISRAARDNIAASHDLWRYLFRRLIETNAEIEKLEVRVLELESRGEKC